MGLCESCQRPQYEKLTEEKHSKVISLPIAPNHISTPQTTVQEIVNANGSLIAESASFCQNVTEVLQKFANGTSYKKRYIWIEIGSSTIHLSDYSSKERRHKEASLLEATSVDAVPPARRKRASVGPGESSDGLFDEESYLTISFQRGGGVDLLFKSKYERDMWMQTLQTLIDSIKSNSSVTENVPVTTRE